MRYAFTLIVTAALATLVSTLAISCARTCETPPPAATDSAIAASDDPCLLNCGDYGACREPLPVCCNGKCQRAACEAP